MYPANLLEADERIHSKNPCPFCGGHNWYGYNLNTDGTLARAYTYALIDMEEGSIQSIAAAIDECCDCGATISIPGRAAKSYKERLRQC